MKIIFLKAIMKKNEFEKSVERELKAIKKEYKLTIEITRTHYVKIRIWKKIKPKQAFEAEPALPPLKKREAIAWLQHVYKSINHKKDSNNDSLICELIHEKQLQNEMTTQNALTMVVFRRGTKTISNTWYDLETLLKRVKESQSQVIENKKKPRKNPDYVITKKTLKKKKKMTSKYQCPDPDCQDIPPFAGASGFWYHRKRIHGDPIRPYRKTMKRKEKCIKKRKQAITPPPVIKNKRARNQPNLTIKIPVMPQVTRVENISAEKKPQKNNIIATSISTKKPLLKPRSPLVTDSAMKKSSIKNPNDKITGKDKIYSANQPELSRQPQGENKTPQSETRASKWNEIDLNLAQWSSNLMNHSTR